MDRSKINILVVDDERGLCAGVQEALRREGYVVDAANDARQALELLGRRLYNLVLSDVRMPEMSGLQLLKEARQKSRDTLFILMTAYGTVPSAVEAMKEGAYDYLTKPLDMQRLRALVLKALEFQSVVSENSELRLRLKKRSEPSLLVGDSEAIRKVILMADEVARSDVTVLIEGESGTGKEIVARAIHQLSPRRSGPFFAVNCAAMPESLIESELFGHEKGAFTGAVERRAGCFELAQAGTLLLDEVSEMRELLEVPVECCDERYSTVIARRALAAGGRRPAAHRAVVDKVAAAAILQTWLDRQREWPWPQAGPAASSQ